MNIRASTEEVPGKLSQRAAYRESDLRSVVRRLAKQLDMHHEALRNWIWQDEADHGAWIRPNIDVAEANQRLLWRDMELHLVMEILKVTSAFASDCGPAEPAAVMRLVDGHHGR